MATPDFAVLQQAAQWFSVLRGDRVRDRERQDWQAWLSASDAHRRAWEQVQEINAQFEGLPVAQAGAALRAPRRNRRMVLRTLALFCAGAGAWRASQLPAVRDYVASVGASYRTDFGETRAVSLPDGGEVWLNSASAIDVDYRDDMRRIDLLAGEVLIHSASDRMQPPRPMVVDTASGRLRALGTRFTVREQGDFTHLAVFDGAVRIEREPASGPVQVLKAGQQVRFTRKHIGTVEAAQGFRQAWRQGVLVADNMRLADFIDELARYRRGYLACAPEVANLLLVGAYPLRDSDAVLAAVAATLPVRIVRTTSWWVTVEPRA